MSDNASFLYLSSNTSYPPSFDCTSSTITVLMLAAFCVTNVFLILPLSILVLYLGYQRWRQRRILAAATSHSDIFTYNILVMEMIMLSGCLFYCVGAYTDLPEMMRYGLEIFFSTWTTKIHFHTLTCVERYLAVVHPVTYLGLKNKSGVRIRNFSIGCVWLCFVCMISVALTSDMASMIVYFCLVTLALIVVCLCCISVLCALRRPGPGDVGRDREHDQMKQRAFYTIVTITGVLLLCFGGMLVGNALEASLELSASIGCVMITSSIWFSLPSSLVLPLLFLHRAGKLPGCKHNT